MAIALILPLIGPALGLAACGGSSSGSGYANSDVQYTFSGAQITHNANNSLTYTLPGISTDYWDLTWFCGNNKDHRSKTIRVTFKKVNNTWVLNREDISGGACS
jgi:hypothetical protein